MLHTCIIVGHHYTWPERPKKFFWPFQKFRMYPKHIINVTETKRLKVEYMNNVLRIEALHLYNLPWLLKRIWLCRQLLVYIAENISYIRDIKH